LIGSKIMLIAIKKKVKKVQNKNKNWRKRKEKKKELKKKSLHSVIVKLHIESV
jgi:hypothetical protein